MIKFRLKVMLAIHEMTQKDLTAATGIRQATISAIATGNIKELPVGVLDKHRKQLYNNGREQKACSGPSIT